MTRGGFLARLLAAPVAALVGCRKEAGSNCARRVTGPLLPHPTTVFFRAMVHLGWILGIAYVASLATDREPLAMLIVVLLADHCFQHARMSTNATWRINGWDKC